MQPVMRTVVLIAAIGTAFAPAAAVADIGIGLAAPLSGAFQPLGAEMKAGAEAAIADINAAGGILGQPLKLEAFDDACDTKQAVLVAGQLSAAHVAFVDGHLCSGASIAASAAYAAAHILQISPASTAAAYTDDRAGPGTFRLAGREDRQGGVAGTYLAHVFAGKSVAFLDDKTAYGHGLTKAALAAFDAAGQKETLTQSYDAGAKSYAALAAVLAAANVDAVYVGGAAADIAAIVRALKDKGERPSIVGGDTLTDDDFFKAAGDASDGVVMTALPDLRIAPSSAALVAAFRQRQIEPAGYTLYSYAAVQIWAQAAAQAKSSEYGKVSAAIASGTFNTALGPVKFDAEGDAVLPGYALYVWKNGDFTQLAP